MSTVAAHTIVAHFGTITAHFNTIAAHLGTVVAHFGTIVVRFRTVAAHFGTIVVAHFNTNIVYFDSILWLDTLQRLTKISFSMVSPHLCYYKILFISII